jgi:MFS family permease
MQTTDLAVNPPAAQRSLGPDDYKTLSLAALGSALEFYDFIIFVFFAPIIGQLFFPPSIPDWLRQLQTFGIFAAGYLARPLGGIMMAHFGDLLGRKRMFTLSVLLMAVPTLVMGLLPTYASIGLGAPVLLLTLRVLQGAAVGGEIPGSWVFVSEHVPPRHVGYACGTLAAGLSAGILLGSLVAAAVNQHFSSTDIRDYAWRIPFLLGGVFGVFSASLRRWLRETPVFAQLQSRKQLADKMPLKAVLRDHRRAVIVSMLLTWMLASAIIVVILMTPALLQKRFHVDATTSLLANCVSTVCFAFGCVIFGTIAGRVGVRRTLVIGNAALALSYYAMLRQFSVDTSLLIPLYAVVGFFVGVVGAIPFVMVNAFPPEVRFSGISFSYNIAYAIFGGLTPVVVALMMKSEPIAPAYYVAAICVLGMITSCFARKRQETD